MEVLYHISGNISGGISPYIGLKNRYGRYLQSIGSCCMAIAGMNKIYTGFDSSTPRAPSPLGSSIVGSLPADE